MRLYTLLFESGQTNYGDPNNFALFTRNDVNFVLVNIEKFKEKALENPKLTQDDYIASMAKTELGYQHSDDCMGAVEINYIASSEKYPGAGSALYAIVSNYFHKPIVSDRKGSSSDFDKKAWSKIEANSDWVRIPLDNYYNTHDEKQYWDIRGVGASREVKQLPGPRTIPTNDDCNLPNSSLGTEKGIKQMLGSADAHLYVGSKYNARRLIVAGETLLAELAEKGFIIDNINQIYDDAEQLFVDRFFGVFALPIR